MWIPKYLRLFILNKIFNNQDAEVATVLNISKHLIFIFF